MKILQVIDSLDTGGAESLLAELCLQWKNSGLEPEVLALCDGDSSHRVRLQDSGISVAISPHRQLNSPLHTREIARTISAKRFDLAHVHLYPAQLWVAMALGTTRGAPPGITTEHNTWNRRRDYKWMRPVERWMFSQYRAAVCIGGSTKSTLDEWLGPGICPTCVIANGIDLTRFRPARTPARLPEGINGAPTILCTGSLTDRKDQETLVRAVGEIEGVHVLLAGDGPMKQSIHRVVRELGIESRIHFLGIRHDIPELVAASTIYAQPSRVDGFCIATLEAMAGGLPVIASDIPGLGDLTRDCGLLFPVGDHHQLAEGIRRLLTDSALRRDLSSRAIAQAQRYSIEQTAAQYRRVFESAVNNTALPDQLRFAS